MDLDLDPTPATVELAHCEYVAPCRKKNCRERATTIARKIDAVGRFIRQIARLQFCRPTRARTVREIGS